jgi:hypothetical protein
MNGSHNKIDKPITTERRKYYDNKKSNVGSSDEKKTTLADLMMTYVDINVYHGVRPEFII